MKDAKLVKEITSELVSKSEERYRLGAEAYFREGITIHGVRGPQLHDIERKYYALVKNKSKEDIIALCDALLAVGYHEELSIAFLWAYRIRKKLEPSDFRTLERWLKSHVSNWAACDVLCTKALGEFVFAHPEFIPRVRKWAASRNRWLRRAAAVTMIISLRRGAHLKEAFQIADDLLMDRDDMVQKGYGWMLKEGTKRFPDDIFRFVMARKDRMPRTALRYAIEKYPPEMRKRAMERA